MLVLTVRATHDAFWMCCQLCLPCSRCGKHIAPEALGNTLWIRKPTLLFLNELKIIEGIQGIFSYLLVVKLEPFVGMGLRAWSSGLSNYQKVGRIHP